MKPVDQTVMKPPNGNCVAACVASILELPLDEVPNFIEADEFWDDLNGWLAKRGLYIIVVPADGRVPRGYHIIDGRSKSGPWNHVVVGYEGKMVHDPNPKRRGIKGAPEAYWVFVTTDPAEAQR